MDVPGYQTFHDSAGFHLHTQSGCIQVSGPHQVEFLQRQTTNDLHLLSENQFSLSALTSPTARLLDVFYLMKRSMPDDSFIQVISLTGNGKGMTAYLKSRIFFMDKVTVTDQSQEYAQISIGGPRAPDLLIKSGLPQLPQPGEYINTRLAGVEVHLLGGYPQVDFTYRLLVPSNGWEPVSSALLGLGMAELSQETYDVLRIEAGLPAAAHELTDAYTPLEIDLGVAISETKGCFTGQEVLARQRTYDKITRKMVGLRFSSPVISGGEIFSGGHPVGTLTSTAFSPRLGPIGLAIIRRPSNEPGTVVEVKTIDRPVSGIVAELPFVY